MSKMKELYEKVAADDVLQEKFAQIIKDAEKAGKEETEVKLAAFAKEAGSDVTVEEMQAFFKELAETNQNELSDAELDMVAGGKALGYIMFSLATFGIGCALSSIYGNKIKESCDEYAKDTLE